MIILIFLILITNLLRLIFQVLSYSENKELFEAVNDLTVLINELKISIDVHKQQVIEYQEEITNLKIQFQNLKNSNL